MKIGKGDVVFGDIFDDIALYSQRFIVDRKKNNGKVFVTMLKYRVQEVKESSEQIEDINVDCICNEEFSIGNNLGYAPTLLNAGMTTNRTKSLRDGLPRL